MHHLLEVIFLFVCLSLPGWQWSPLDRPSFSEIHQAFETMFHDSSISEGTVTHSLFSNRAFTEHLNWLQ